MQIELKSPDFQIRMSETEPIVAEEVRTFFLLRNSFVNLLT